MYLNTYLDRTDINITEYARESTTYSTFYFFWRDELFSRCMKLFKDVTDPIPPHEVEVRLMIQGHCGIAICPLDKELTAFFGTPNGVAKYRDRLPKYTVRSPIYSKNLKVGTDVIVVYNDTLMNPLYDLIHHYACILAHTEVTYIHTAVMARIPNGAPVAKSEIQKTSFGQFFKSLFNGKFGFVADPGDMGIEYAGAHTNITQGVVDLWTARQRILADFLADIGIKTGLDKRSNTVSDEANADTPALLVNLKDMLEAREEGFDRVNKRFGTNWSVQLNEDLDYVNMFTDPRVDITEKKENGEIQTKEDNRTL